MSGSLKILASAAIILGGGYIGMIMASSLDVRVVQLEQMRLLIEQMGFSISFLKMPLADALYGAAKSRNDAVGRIFADAAEEIKSESLAPSAAFSRAVLKNRDSLCVLEQDLQILTEFAQSLGMGDADSELSNINAACARLKIAQTAAERERNRRGRMWRGIGFLGGMLAVILLI